MFSRIGKALIPTYAGEIYIEAAKKMLEIKADFDGKLSDISNNIKGRIRIGLQSRRSPFIIPSLYHAFSKNYPEIEIIFVTNVNQILENMLYKNELDLILSNKTHPLEWAEYIHIATENILLAVSKEHPMSQRGKCVVGSQYKWIDIRLFKDELFIIQNENQSQRQFSNQIMKTLNFEPKKIMIEKNIETSTKMAAIGLGVSFILDTYKKHTSYSPEPCCFLIGEPPKTVEYYAIHKKGIYMPSYVDTAIDIIRTIL